MAQIYKNIKTGVKAELIEIDEKAKQVHLKKLSDGKPTSSLLGAFEKYWKLVDEPSNTKTKKVEKKSAVSEVEEVVTKAEEKIAEEKPKTKKPKKEEKKAKKEKSGKSNDERIAIRDSFVKHLTDKSINARVSVKYPMWIDIKIGEKNAFGIGLNANHIRVRSIKELIPDGFEYHEVKGGFSAGLKFTYDEISTLEKLILDTNKNFKDSDILKRKGKEKSVKSEKKNSKNVKKVEKEKK